MKYNVRVGDDRDELHEWLRTTAFYARTSSNALAVAAWTQVALIEQPPVDHWSAQYVYWECWRDGACALAA